MMIPVYVQEPNKPDSARLIGKAHEWSEPATVAQKVGIPKDSFIGGKVIRGKTKSRWVLVALSEAFENV